MVADVNVAVVGGHASKCCFLSYVIAGPEGFEMPALSIDGATVAGQGAALPPWGLEVEVPPVPIGSAVAALNGMTTPFSGVGGFGH